MNKYIQKHPLRFFAQFAGGVLLVAWLFYYIKFGVGTKNYFSLSSDQSAWAEFGDFFNMWISFANLILLGTLSYFVHHYDKERNQKIDAEEQARNSPILVFKREKNKWFIKNISQHPALNIFITERNTSEVKRLFNKQNGNDAPDEEFKGQFNNITALAGMEEIELVWAVESNKLFGLYQDILGNDYVSITDNFETAYLPKKEQQENSKKVFKEIEYLYSHRIQFRSWVEKLL